MQIQESMSMSLADHLVWVILSILAHLAHLAQSYFSLIVSAIKTYNCDNLQWLKLGGKWPMLTTFFLNHCDSFYLLDKIQNYWIYSLRWTSKKKRTDPNKLNELKYSKSLTQMTSYAHWHAFLYLHAQKWINSFFELSCLK